jgi:uncharacterized protein (DUF1800 family)
MKHLNMSISKNKLTALCLGLSLWLVGCGGEEKSGKVSFLAADGQVTLVTATPTSVNAYAAARFLEQASWGPTPASVAEVQKLGYEAWIDKQLAMRATILNAPNYVIDFDDNNKAAQNLAFSWTVKSFYELPIISADQLRLRTTWALYNFIVFGQSGFALDRVEYFNALQANSLGNFKDLVRAVTLHAAMGNFLNNNQNVANSPNENYARELMQLFTVGLVKLGQDGSILRDAQGKPIETYSQTDVIMATKALSGWEHSWVEGLPRTNGSNLKVPMRPRSWKGAHDTTEKTVLGVKIPAGQTIEQDLDSLLNILTTHPNAAPFVSRRLIQSLVTSDPSPEYITRVSKVFKDSGGNLPKLVKAILIDPEARAGDDPTKQIARVGKIKEPYLHFSNTMRALGCTATVASKNGGGQILTAQTQDPYVAPNVFGYFAPNHKAPESLTPAPEQKLIGSDEVRRKVTSLSWEMKVISNFTNAGCEIDLFVNAVEKSDEALISLISERFFKGAMPATLRLGAKNLLSKELATETSVQKVAKLLEVLISTPTYGVIK